MRRFLSELSEKQATTFAAVLASAGIGFKTEKENGRWRILVEDMHADNARKVLDEYVSENQAEDKPSGVSDRLLPKTLSGLWAGMMLIAVYFAAGSGRDIDVFVENFGASASGILNGDYYRTATALFFHGDAAHLVSNVICIIIFGTAVCGITGWGMGWLMILAGGMTGNLFNAYFYRTGHISIGASTAVFGAVGILSGYQFLKRVKQSGQSGWKKSAWLPLACGLALLAFLGAGEYTDIMAHLFGFASGLLLGVGYAALISRPPASVFQYTSIIIAFSVLVFSWIQGAG